MRPPHSSTDKGKHGYVILRDGTEFVDKFLDKKGRFVNFETYGRIRTSELRVFTIFKSRVISGPLDNRGLNEEDPRTLTVRCQVKDCGYRRTSLPESPRDL